MIINHDHPEYRVKWSKCPENKFNGAFYYSKEICKFIIPNVKTDRNWVTINIRGRAFDHSIIFIHNNLHPENYNWLEQYDDLILVCGVPSTMEKVAHLGTPIYLPLSIDVEDVKSYIPKCKTKDTAFVGRRSKAKAATFDDHVDFISNVPRTTLLKEMAKYEKVYAVGRTAIEAKVLNCDVLPYDERFPDPSIWKVLDSKDAAIILQERLNDIDGRKKNQGSIIY